MAVINNVQPYNIMQFVEKYQILYPIRVSYLRGRKAFPDNMWILSQGKNNVFLIN